MSLKANLVEKTKLCRKCGLTKPRSEFYLHTYKATGWSHRGVYCKDCLVGVSKEYREIVKKKYNRLFEVYRGMKKRCYTPKASGFKYYGNRGIKICDEWKNDFLVFYKWAKDKHKIGLTIDRKDNDGNYEPGNCRFVTSRENSWNRSTTKLDVKKVIKIRKLLKKGKLFQREIGEIFGVCSETIAYINNNKTWKI